LGTIETTAGLLTFPLHAALVQRLQHVRIGTDVLIRYTGPQTSKAGRLFKGFEVFVSGSDDGIADVQVPAHDVTPREA
jgi:hypothetical protein